MFHRVRGPRWGALSRRTRSRCTLGGLSALHRLLVSLGALVSACLPAEAVTAGAQQPAGLEMEHSRRQVVAGAYVPDPGWPNWWGSLEAYDRETGRRPSIIQFYTGWDSAFPTDFVATLDRRGQTPLITWQGWSDSRGPNDPRYSDAQILSGKFDAYIWSWADGARRWGRPLYVRWGCEANGSWNEWDPGVNGNTAEQYIATFRRVRSIFAAAGATNVKVLWTAIADFPGATPLDRLYPGDEYVDGVGIDGYNWGSTQPWSSWQTFAEVFEPTISTMRRLTDKPLWLTEVGSTEHVGDKAAWLDGMFSTVARDPRIEGLVWFNINKETDWRINSSPAALAAFRGGLAAPHWR